MTLSCSLTVASPPLPPVKLPVFRIMAGKCSVLMKQGKYEIPCPCDGFEALSEQLQPGNPDIICLGCEHYLSQHGPTSSADIQPTTDKLISLQKGEAGSAKATGKRKMAEKEQPEIDVGSVCLCSETIQKLAELVDEKRVVHIRGTPASGKTTLA
ncbi:hypothetical protein BJX63DRAFT_191983 [Aspergillus granulosus]|uniref:Uncharacterized protein n=1 Tax=Aspergillus granulosus TaxID=176169 RepID=A0ABR4HI36_9EURO